MRPTYIGLDFEATGTNPWGLSVPIQIGLALVDGSEFSSYIGGWTFPPYEWNDEAYEVHRISKDDVTNKYPDVATVDSLAAAWLAGMIGSTGRMWHIAVGWNIASYDRQFITRWMPLLNSLISYRSVDLNTLLFYKTDTEQEYVALKKRWNEETEQHLFIQPQYHDALYDAKRALRTWELLKQRNS